MIDYSIVNRAALLRLNNPPLNVLTYEVLDALVLAMDRANNDASVNGIIIIGSNNHFTSGADINLFQSIKNGTEAMALSRKFQVAFDKIESSGKPVIAALAGAVMGGALELAMAAHIRICTSTCKLSMPEVTLGIIPGAGGTQRLPRLIGIKPALDMMLTGKPVAAKDALQLGLVDAICEPDSLETAAAALLLSRSHPVKTSTIEIALGTTIENAAAIAEAKKKIASGRAEIIAPSIIITTVERGISGTFSAGLSAEQHGFAQCMDTRATRNKLHLFFASRATAKIPELDRVEQPDIITTAVIGLGSMGSGIAQAFAAGGKKVLLLDTDTATAQKGLDRIRESIERKVERGSSSRKQADELLGRFSLASDWNELSTVNLVIEAVFEDIQIKRTLISKLDSLCAPGTIIATNTSTINLAHLTHDMKYPERLIGLHFFNPAHSMPLVEVVRHEKASATTVAASVKFTKDIKKTPVLLNNREGFIVNRIFIPYFIEAFKLLEEGFEPRDIDHAMTDFGFPMGPLTLIDMTGIDILAFTGKLMHEAFPYHLDVPKSVSQLVAGKQLGQKTGRGVYHYEGTDRTPRDNPATAALLGGIRKQIRSVPATDSSAIVDRLVLRMVSEAFRVIEENIALRESDIDVAMVLGTGFPDFRGGVIKYAYERGISDCIAHLTDFATTCGERYQPCNYLTSIL